MRYRTRGVAILCGMLLAGCSSRSAPPAMVETDVITDPMAVYAAVQRREAAVQTLRARFRARVQRGKELRNADGVLLVKKPDRFRLRLVSPFGLTVFDYTSWDGHDRMQLPLEGKQLSDAQIAEHSPFSPADMRQVFLGSAAPGAAAAGATQCSAQGASAETVVTCRDREGALVRVMRVQTATREVVQEVRFVAGQPDVIMEPGDYRQVGATVLPFRIDLTYPQKGVHLEIEVRSYEVNPPLADSLFEAAPAGGAGS